MRLAEVADVVGGTLVEAATADLVVDGAAYVDSRSPVPGGLFVAVVGERVDGHAYADGAHAVLGSRATSAPTVVVDDPVAALGRLARHVVDRLVDSTGLQVLALTGSQGKTGTKDYLAHVLATHGETVATTGNNNNELGVPLTVLRADERTEHLVVEMGARGIGHLAYLCELAPPRVGAVLNVGTAHIGEFGSAEAIALAKGELVEALPVDGTAVLNADDPRVAAMARRTPATVTSFGAAQSATLRWSDVVLDDLGRPSFVLHHAHQRAHVMLRQVGPHQVLNAAAAAAMAVAAGLGLDDVAAALSTAESGSRWRMELGERADGLVVVNDAYNANPASMAAALDALAAIGRSGRRTIAVLGEMLELGPTSAAGHREVGRVAAEGGVDVLVVVGDAAAAIAEGARAVVSWHGEVVVVAGREQASAWVGKNAGARDAVLVKASNGAALYTVAEDLLEGSHVSP